MPGWIRFAALLAITWVAEPGSVAAGALRPQDLLLADRYPPITPEQKRLDRVPFAPGAPAVLLLHARHHQVLEDPEVRQRIEYHRRIKILDPAGVERFGNFAMRIFGDWRIQKAEARTVSPDGLIFDARDSVHLERSEGGDDAAVRLVRVAWPRVEVGAILDLHLTVFADGFPSERWVVQERLPVLDSRFIVQAPGELDFRVVGSGVASGQVEPRSMTLARSRAWAWLWRDVPALREEPHMPPLDEAAASVMVLPVRYGGGGSLEYRFPDSWADLGARMRGRWESWLRASCDSCRTAALHAVAGSTTVEGIAEAIRRRVAETIRVTGRDAWPTAPSAVEAFSRGEGNSADAAGVAAAMLREVGVPARIVVFRRRGTGELPMDAPIPNLFNDVLVVVPGSSGQPIHLGVADPLPAGTLPAEACGAPAMVLDAETDAPGRLPEARPDDNRTFRDVAASLDRGGTLEAEGSFRFVGAPAAAWRRKLRPLTPDRRREAIRDLLRGGLPDSEVDGIEIDRLGEDDSDLCVRARWKVEDFASRTGRWLVLRPFPFDRIDAADWISETRESAVDLGGPSEMVDRIVLRIPAPGEIILPVRETHDSTPFGRYEANCARRDGTIECARKMRIETTRVPVTSYGDLRAWMLAVAQADHRPILVGLH